jgi:hypothetical protein
MLLSFGVELELKLIPLVKFLLDDKSETILCLYESN